MPISGRPSWCNVRRRPCTTWQDGHTASSCLVLLGTLAAVLSWSWGQPADTQVQAQEALFLSCLAPALCLYISVT